MMTAHPNCPKCGSPNVETVTPEQVEGLKGLGPQVPKALRFIRKHGPLQGCRDCRAWWEPLPPGDHTDSDGTPFPFPEPCNNCAFRPGSPELEDKAEWKKLLAMLKSGGRFYCHKGVPLGGEHGFQYPVKEDGTPDEERMRLCRGFLNAWAKWEGVW